MWWCLAPYEDWSRNVGSKYMRPILYVKFIYLVLIISIAVGGCPSSLINSPRGVDLNYPRWKLLWVILT